MNHEIPLSTAAEMTSRYRSNKEDILKSEYQGNSLLALCETFAKASVEAVLSQSSATHLRIYYGMDEDLKMHAILVGADAEGADILPAANLLEGDPGTILEDAQRCPPYCPPASPLNEDE